MSRSIQMVIALFVMLFGSYMAGSGLMAALSTNALVPQPIMNEVNFLTGLLMLLSGMCWQLVVRMGQVEENIQSESK
jgi:phosphate/sulfate permease